MHKTYPYIPLLKEESLLFPLLRPQRCRVYIYRPKYRETKEEFDRGCRGRRLKKIQNTGNASVEAKKKKDREAVEIKKLSSLYRRMAGSLALDPLDRPR